MEGFTILDGGRKERSEFSFTGLSHVSREKAGMYKRVVNRGCFRSVSQTVRTTKKWEIHSLFLNVYLL